MTEKIHCHHSSHVQFVCDWGNATTILPVHIYIYIHNFIYIYMYIDMPYLFVSPGLPLHVLKRF